MNTVVVLLLILLMVGFNALYVAAEFATVGSRRSRIQESAESGSGPAKSLLAILQDPKRLDNYVAACQIGITLSSLVAGAYGQAQLIPLFEDTFGGASRTIAVIVVLLFITTLQVVLGELLPKTVALRYPEALAIGTLTPMRISQSLLRPLVAVFNGSAFAIMRRLGLHVDHSHSHVHSPAELAGLYRESAAGGLIDPAEREMLAGALSVTNRLVREIMTPRRRLRTIEASTPIADALAELSASPYSRFPVTEDGEEIVGLVTLRDLFLANEEATAATVADVAENPMVVSEMFQVPSLMNTFSQQGVHAAMVVNEFGSISGMVTREDAIEEVLGEFNDEFDVEPDPITITGSSVSVRGDVLLAVLNERFDLALPVDQVDTVSGYVWHHLGRLPAIGDTVPLPTAATLAAAENLDDLDRVRSHPPLRVDSVDGTLVDRASFTLPADDPEDSDVSVNLLAVDVVTGVVLPIAAVIALVVINGVFVAAEFALVGSRRSRIDALAADGNRGARWLLRVFDRPTGKDGYIAVAQLGITLASIGLGMYGEPAIAHWLYDPFESLGLSEGAAHTVGFLVALSIITYLHVVFGEMIPKAMALATPEGTSLRVNPVMRTFSVLFRPAVVILNWLALSLMRLLRIPEPDAALSLYSSEELAIVTDESADGGELPELQREIIHNIFELEDLTAEELMTSRSHLLAIEHDAGRADIAARIQASTTSRYPVFVDDLDHVIGLLHVKDFVRASQSDDPIDLTTLVRRLPTVGGNTAADDLLARFKSERVHAALVVNELGSTIGLVTLDDIISEVIDDPAGDHDLPAVVHDDGSVTLDGETTLTELLEDFGLDFRHDDVTTLAGLVLAVTGTLPTIGDRVELQGHELTVEDIAGHKLTQIRVARVGAEVDRPESGERPPGRRTTESSESVPWDSNPEPMD